MERREGIGGVGSTGLTIGQFPVGPQQSNAYLVWNESSGQAVLVDAGGEAARLLAELSAHGHALAAILQTHAHADHIAALPEIVKVTGAPVYLHPDAKGMLLSAAKNLSALTGVPITAPVETRPVNEGDRLALLDRIVEVLHTPGHARGSVCYHFIEDGVVFTGDVLFRGSIGRTDLPGGSLETLLASIRVKLLALPDETRVFAGHGEPTTIGRERDSNPHLRHYRPDTSEV